MNVHEKLQEIFREVFDDKKLVIKRETTSKDIEEWDSLAQITLVSECETVFKLDFDIEEIVALTDVGGMIDLIERKLSDKR